MPTTEVCEDDLAGEEIETIDKGRELITVLILQLRMGTPDAFNRIVRFRKDILDNMTETMLRQRCVESWTYLQVLLGEFKVSLSRVE